MTSNNTTLEQYSATSGEQILDPSPDAVFDAFDTLTPFQHAIELNNSGDEYFVGKAVSGERGVYRVYAPPTSGTDRAFIGTIQANRYEDPAAVLFTEHPVKREDGSNNDNEQTVTQVMEMRVRERDEFHALDACLNELKTDLTGKDWTVDGRAETSWDDWHAAILTLIQFYDTHYDTPVFDMTHRFLKGSTMHGIGRYPTDASKLLSMAEMRLDRLDDTDEHSREHISPFALERLLLDYAEANGITAQSPVSDEPVRGDA